MFHFKTIDKTYGLIGRPMDRDGLIGAGINYNPQPHGGVPPVVEYHVRLLGVSLFVWVKSDYWRFVNNS